MLKKLKYDLPDESNRSSLRQKMVVVEKRIGGDKLVSPELQAVSYFAQPFVEGWIQNFDSHKIDSKWLKGKKKDDKEKDTSKEAGGTSDKPNEVSVTYGNRDKKNNASESMSTDLGKSPQQRVI
jgi:hypothetical protein